MKRPKRIEAVARGGHGTAVYAQYALRLEALIKGLSHGADRCYPQGCWCDVFIGNPMLGGQHLHYCVQCQRLMKEIQEGGE